MTVGENDSILLEITECNCCPCVDLAYMRCQCNMPTDICRDSSLLPLKGRPVWCPIVENSKNGLAMATKGTRLNRDMAGY